MKEGIGRENYFDKKNVKESERRIWTRARCGNTYNLGRYEKNREKRRRRRDNNTWREKKLGLKIMEFLKKKYTKAKKKRSMVSRRYIMGNKE